MTLIRLRGLLDAYPAPEAGDVTVTVQRWAGRNPAPAINGADVILPRAVPVGAGLELNVPPTDGRYCLRWVISTRHPGIAPVIRHTTVPAVASIDFGALPDVNPETFEPSDEAVAAWDAAIAMVQALTTTAAGSAASAAQSATSAAQSATSAGQSAAAAAGETTAAGQAAGIADAAATAAGLDAGVADLAAEEARAHALDADHSAQLTAADVATAAAYKLGTAGDRADALEARAGAITAKTDAETARAGAATAKTAAEAARDVALAGQMLGTQLASGTDLNALTTAGRYRVPTPRDVANHHAPFEGFIGVVDVLLRDTTRPIQIAYPQQGGSWYDARTTYRRALNSAGWTAWYVQTSQRMVQTAGSGRVLYLGDEVNQREQLIYGDTGERDVFALFQTGSVVTGLGNARLRRVGQMVTLTLGPVTKTAGQQAFSGVLPAGFRPSLFASATAGDSSGNMANVYVNGGNGDVLVRGASQTFGANVTVTFLTSDPWPTALPGTAVGSIPA